MKKIVNFIGNPEFFKQELGSHGTDLDQYADEEGKVWLAWVYGVNHPRIRRGYIRTSIVVKRYKNGNFDTLNTQYKKVLDKTD